MEEIARRNYRFLRRTIKNVVYYKEAIEGFVRELSRKGFDGILLVGASDMDFIVEHACSINGLRLRRMQSAEEAAHLDDVLFLMLPDVPLGGWPSQEK